MVAAKPNNPQQQPKKKSRRAYHAKWRNSHPGYHAKYMKKLRAKRKEKKEMEKDAHEVK